MEKWRRVGLGVRWPGVVGASPVRVGNESARNEMAPFGHTATQLPHKTAHWWNRATRASPMGASSSKTLLGQNRTHSAARPATGRVYRRSPRNEITRKAPGVVGCVHGRRANQGAVWWRRNSAQSLPFGAVNCSGLPPCTVTCFPQAPSFGSNQRASSWPASLDRSSVTLPPVGRGRQLVGRSHREGVPRVDQRIVRQHFPEPHLAHERREVTDLAVQTRPACAAIVAMVLAADLPAVVHVVEVPAAEHGGPHRPAHLVVVWVDLPVGVENQRLAKAALFHQRGVNAPRVPRLDHPLWFGRSLGMTRCRLGLVFSTRG